MTLTKRERILASIVAALVALLALWLGFRLFSGPLVLRRGQIAALQDKINAFQDQVVRAKKAQDRMAQWNRQALPSDAARAGALYQSWLLELAGKAGFRQKKVDPGEVRGQSSAYRLLPFTVRGQASLDELVGFLFDFYSAGHLHQIRRITIRPVEKSKDLDLVIAVEALSLPTADRKDQLSQEKGRRLKLGSLAEYRKAIAVRNPLAPYRPPPPVRPPEPPVVFEPKPEPFDPSRFAYVTGIVEVNGEPQVWVKARTSDEKFQLRQGDKFQLGPFSAVVARIDSRNVEIEVDGKRHTVPLGSSVRGGIPAANAKTDSSFDGGNPGKPGMDPRPGDREPERPGDRERNGGGGGMRLLDPKGDAPTLRSPPGNGDKSPAGERSFSKRNRRSRGESRGEENRPRE